MDNPLTLTSGHFALLIGWCILALLVGWCITFWIIRKNSDFVETALKDGLLSKLLTIILVLLATTILALTNKLTEAAAAIFGGVVGYVLGTTNLGQSRGRHEQGKPNKVTESDKGQVLGEGPAKE